MRTTATPRPSIWSARTNRPPKHLSHRRCPVLRATPAANDLEVSFKELANSRVELTLRVSPEATQRAYDAYIRKVSANSKIPGFRPGQKVPLGILIKSRGGEDAFNGEILMDLIERSAETALRDWQGKAIEDSDRIESSVPDLIRNFKPSEQLEFCISFDTLSQVKWTSPFRDLRVEILDTGNEDTDAANVDTYVRAMLKRKGSQRVVIERGMEQGDVAILDFLFLRRDSRKELPELKQEKFRFDTDLPDALGVTDRLIGIRVGETREFEMTFPDDWEPSVFRGMEALAVVKCRELFAWDLPELTDAFVQSLDQAQFKTVEDLRTAMLAAEANRRAESFQDLVQDTVRRELAKIVDMDVSETAITETAKVKYQAMLLEMQSKGKVGPEALKSMATEQMLNNYIASHRTEIENDQKGIAAMSAIFKELELEVTEDELQKEVGEAVKSFQGMGEEYDENRLKEVAQDVLQNSKVIDWLIENGNITVLPYKATSKRGP